MTLKSFFTRLGKDIVEVVEYPFKHAAQLAKVLDAIIKDTAQVEVDAPIAKQLIVGLVEKFDALTPDALSALAGKGFDFEADAKTVADVEALFGYVTQTFLPGVEKLYAGLANPGESQPAAASAQQPTPTAPFAQGAQGVGVSVQHT